MSMEGYNSSHSGEEFDASIDEILGVSKSMKGVQESIKELLLLTAKSVLKVGAGGGDASPIFGLGSEIKELKVVGANGITTYIERNATGTAYNLVIDASLVNSGTDAEEVKSIIQQWLHDHPEATTTVADGSITMAKLSADLKTVIDNAGSVKDVNIYINEEEVSDTYINYEYGIILKDASGKILAQDIDTVEIKGATSSAAGLMTATQVKNLASALTSINSLRTDLNWLTNKVQDIEEGGAGLSDAPSDSKLYGRINGEWREITEETWTAKAKYYADQADDASVEAQNAAEDARQSQDTARSAADTASSVLNEIQHALDDAAGKGESEAIAALAGKVEMQSQNLCDLSREVTELTYTKEPIDLSQFDIRDYFISSDNKWNTTNYWRHKMIPCNGKDKFYVVANDTANTYYAWLVDEVVNPGNLPNYCEGEVRETISIGNDKLIEAPLDAHFLYIAYNNHSSGTKYEPKEVYKTKQVKIPQIDDTLNKEGFAADAEKVGSLFRQIIPKVNDALKKIGDIKSETTEPIIPTLSKYNAKLNEDRTKAVVGTASSYGHIVLNLNIEDNHIDFTTWIRTSTNFLVYAFTDDENNVIDNKYHYTEDEYAKSDYYDFSIDKPNGATKLWITCSEMLTPHNITYTITKFLDVKENLVKLENEIKNIELTNEVEFPMSLFLRVAVIGASWDSGYFYYNDEGNTKELNNHSWLANVARLNGIPFYECMARRSATTRRWLGLPQNEVFDPTYNVNEFKPYCLDRFENSDPCDLYIVNLMGNDIKYHSKQYLGSIADINTSDYRLNADSYYGNYSRIISMIKEKAPYARIVCTYSIHDDTYEDRKDWVKAVLDVCELQGNDGVVIPSINWYSDKWYDETFHKKIHGAMIGSHPTTMQLGGIALAFDRLMSKCIAENYDYFNKWYNRYE